MHSKFFIIAGLFCSLFWPEPVLGQEKKPWSFSVFLENDLFANTDLSYTNGIRFSSVSPDLNSFQDPNGQNYPWIEALNTLLKPIQPVPPPGETNHVDQNIAISLGQLMFTPANRYSTTLDVNDRPYAGWLFFGIGYHAKTEKTLYSTELDIGWVGPWAFAKESQDLIHKIGGISLFQGWDNQLKNEPGLQLSFERKHKFLPFQNIFPYGLQFDVISHWGGSVGNVATHINAGAELRLGWSIPDDFGTSTLRPGGDNNAPGLGDLDNRPWQLHVFMVADGRGVLRNIFLDGNTFRSSHSVSKKTFVGDVAIGLTAARKRFRLSYAHVYRSREFKAQDEAQFYGSLSISYSHAF